VISNKSNNAIFQQELSSIFEWMPTCTLIVDKYGTILDANQQALLFFKTETKKTLIEFSNNNSIFVDELILLEILNEISDTKSVHKRKVFLARLDKTIACIDILAVSFPSTDHSFLIQFSDNSHESQDIFKNLVHTFKNNIIQLKPYLNKPGKELLGEILQNEELEGILKNKPKHNQEIALLCQERILQLSALYPELSIGELTLCAYLSLNISIENIAQITGKTPNSLRVAYHRIVMKIPSLNSKDLLKMLKSLK